MEDINNRAFSRTDGKFCIRFIDFSSTVYVHHVGYETHLTTPISPSVPLTLAPKTKQCIALIIIRSVSGGFRTSGGCVVGSATEFWKSKAVRFPSNKNSNYYILGSLIITN
jgi:hypothetical protein